MRRRRPPQPVINWRRDLSSCIPDRGRLSPDCLWSRELTARKARRGENRAWTRWACPPQTTARVVQAALIARTTNVHDDEAVMTFANPDAGAREE